MLPGQAVPVATKGIFTLSADTFDGPITDYAPGTAIIASDNNVGMITGATRGDSKTFGHILGTGSRTSVGNTTDQFAGSYIVVAFDCNAN